MSHSIGVKTTVWACLTKASLTMGWRARFWSPKKSLKWDTTHPFLDHLFAVTESPIHQKGTLKTLHLKTPPQGSWRIRREILIPFLIIVGTQKKLALALVTTLLATTQIDRGLILILLWKIKLKYPFHSWFKFLWFWWLACGFSYWHVISEEWIHNFPLFNVFFRGDIKSLMLGLRQRDMVSMVALLDDVFQTAIRHESIYTRKESLEVVSSLVPCIYTTI